MALKDSINALVETADRQPDHRRSLQQLIIQVDIDIEMMLMSLGTEMFNSPYGPMYESIKEGIEELRQMLVLMEMAMRAEAARLQGGNS